MNFLKKAAEILALFACGAMAMAENTHKVQLFGTVTDAGQVVDRMVIDYGAGAKISSFDKETFSVHAVASTEAFRKGSDVKSYGDYEIDRKIEGISVKKNRVTVYFNQAEGATLAYLSVLRNVPVQLTYTITQNKAITFKSGGKSDSAYIAKYVCDNTVIDEEADLFTSVRISDGINYQFFAPKKNARTLIVWFHGNGEGDFADSQNNVAQILGNRGAVAWATPRAQKLFKNAYVMAFQAPDTWYYAVQDGLLEKAKSEIDYIIQKYDIVPNRIVLSGCSAGGYMSTRMLIAYPDFFSVAMINCPALDVANKRGGQTPSDEELASIARSKTPIWLVQGENDGTVDTEQCAKRLFTILANGAQTREKLFTQQFDSGFRTVQTKDKKYLLTLYETTSDDKLQGKLRFAEDYNQDGNLETIEYSNHWSWIYSLRDNPKSADGVSLWQWAASQL